MASNRKYKKVDKFLASKLPIKMMPATTWRDFLHVLMLDVATRGEVKPEYNYYGISWQTHVADGMHVDGGMKVLSKRTGQILPKSFATIFEKVLDRIFYETEEKKLEHFQKLFDELPGNMRAENITMDSIFAGSINLRTGQVATDLNDKDYE